MPIYEERIADEVRAHVPKDVEVWAVTTRGEDLRVYATRGKAYAGVGPLPRAHWSLAFARHTAEALLATLERYGGA